MNALLKDERMLTGPEAGVTRDAITVDWEWKGRKIKLVDTAGLRRRSKIEDSLEKMSAASTKHAALWLRSWFWFLMPMPCWTSRI